MKQNQKILLVSIGLIGLGIYFFYKQGKADAISVDEEVKVSESGNETPKADWDKVLKKGSQGIEVEILQRALKQLDVDGDFGGLTETRLKKVTGLTQTSLNNYNKVLKAKK